MFKSLPYDAVKDFAMVSTVGLFDFVIVAKQDGPYKTFGDAIAAARRDPTHFNIGTISSGSVQNLTSLLFTSKAALKVPTVPFKTTGDVVLALLSGQVQIGFETLPGVMGQIKSANCARSPWRRRRRLRCCRACRPSPKAAYRHSSWCRGMALSCRRRRRAQSSSA